MGRYRNFNRADRRCPGLGPGGFDALISGPPLIPVVFSENLIQAFFVRINEVHKSLNVVAMSHTRVFLAHF